MKRVVPAALELSRQVARDRTTYPSLETYPLGAESADEAAHVRRKLEGRGEGIGMADKLIAGIVLARGASLLTRNRAHFERVDGLDLAST